MKTPHKHSELIKQWADGAQIEYFCNRTEKWQNIDYPVWNDYTEYRLKPELKPWFQLKQDIILYGYIKDLSDVIDKAWPETEVWRGWHNFRPNLDVEYTIDGNTGKLKSVKMI